MNKSHRNRHAEYEMQRELAQQYAAQNTLNLQLESLTQEGIARVVKRAFESIEKQVSVSGKGERK
jgi:hypothetical protein